jgi:hypothetical protein
MGCPPYIHPWIVGKEDPHRSVCPMRSKQRLDGEKQSIGPFRAWKPWRLVHGAAKQRSFLIRFVPGSPGFTTIGRFSNIGTFEGADGAQGACTCHWFTNHHPWIHL